MGNTKTREKVKVNSGTRRDQSYYEDFLHWKIKKKQVEVPEAVDPPLFAYLFYETHSGSDIFLTVAC
jgi:hypothetical protein